MNTISDIVAAVVVVVGVLLGLTLVAIPILAHLAWLVFVYFWNLV